MKRLLIRADDFGFSEGVNLGLAKMVQHGIVRNVGLMPNMAAAEHGVSLLKDFPVCYGQHTNICVGQPLTDPERIPSLVQENGEFKTATVYRKAEEDFVVLEEALLEIEAQYQHFLELVGDKPCYFEGHAVSSGNFFKALQMTAERHDLRYLDFSSKGPIRFGNTNLYPVMESMEASYDPYASLKKAATGSWNLEGCGMLICHPGYLDHYLLTHGLLTVPRTQEVEMLCDPTVRLWLAEQNVQLVTFDDL